MSPIPTLVDVSELFNMNLVNDVPPSSQVAS